MFLYWWPTKMYRSILREHQRQCVYGYAEDVKSGFIFDRV